MYPAQNRWLKIAMLATLGIVCLGIRTDAVPIATAWPSARIQHLPSRILWAWERPEDLRSVDPGTTAIAYLDQTIRLERDVASERRHQPLTYPSNATMIAVVRIEALPSAMLDALQEQKAISFLLESAERPGIAALQVDFDATKSQRRFYTGLLTDLRRKMPVNLPLSITALASWCSSDDWIAGLPVDEAVPRIPHPRAQVHGQRRNFNP